MGIENRLKLYSEIEEIRGNPLVSYITSTRHKAEGAMASDAIPAILDQLLDIPSDKTAVDLFLVSQGGDPTVAWRIMSLFRDKFEKVNVLIPQAAYSAATLLALGADEIVMHPCGNLGPVDPQLKIQKKIEKDSAPQLIEFGSEDMEGFIDYARNKLGLSDQEQLRHAFELLSNETGPIAVGKAFRSSKLSLTLGTKLLQMHMKDDNAEQKANVIAEKLNKEFFHHGYPVGRREAKEIGLKVIEPDQTLESKMWDVWLDVEEELQCRNPFNPMDIVSQSTIAAQLFRPIQQLNLPSNIPPNLAPQVVQQLLQNLQMTAEEIPAVDFKLKQALVESTRGAAMFITNGKIFSRREWNSAISLNTLNISAKWECIDISSIQDSSGE